MALIWNRYSGSSETNADQDVAALKSDTPIENMIQNLEDKVGRNRPVTERELRDQRKNSPFMLLSYVLTRKSSAQDWFSGVLIHGHESLEVHYIFPKDLLRENYDLRAQSFLVDQVANLAFLAKRADAKTRSQSPDQYLPKIQEHRLKAQNIPLDKNLWKMQQFEDFMRIRREMLATGINQMLASLAGKPALWVTGQEEQLENRISSIEVILRFLVAARLEEAFHDEAWQHIPPIIQNNLEQRITAYLAKHPNRAKILELFDAKLDFCQFSDYVKIITSNWTYFQGDFGNLKIFEDHVKNVTDLRNAFSHNRSVTSSDLAVGEGGLLWLEECLKGVVKEIQEDRGEEGNDHDEYEM